MRQDKQGPHRANYDRNKKRILATQDICGICGKPVDKSIKVPNPMAPTIDHIIPVAKGGHPSDIENLQLAHWTCNRQKSDKIFKTSKEEQPAILGNRNLPQSMDWKSYRSE
jgi:5-methylcytosine-specific restriction endonuclease McrA